MPCFEPNPLEKRSVAYPKFFNYGYFVFLPPQYKTPKSLEMLPFSKLFYNFAP
jgi:hypothetical protein